MVTGFTFVVVGLAQYSTFHASFGYEVQRTVSVILGVVWTMVVSFLIFPYRAGKDLRIKLAANSKHNACLFHKAVDFLTIPEIGEESKTQEKMEFEYSLLPGKVGAVNALLAEFNWEICLEYVHLPRRTIIETTKQYARLTIAISRVVLVMRGIAVERQRGAQEEQSLHPNAQLSQIKELEQKGYEKIVLPLKHELQALANVINLCAKMLECWLLKKHNGIFQKGKYEIHTYKLRPLPSSPSLLASPKGENKKKTEKEECKYISPMELKQELSTSLTNLEHSFKELRRELMAQRLYTEIHTHYGLRFLSIIFCIRVLVEEWENTMSLMTAEAPQTKVTKANKGTQSTPIKKRKEKGKEPAV